MRYTLIPSLICTGILLSCTPTNESPENENYDVMVQSYMDFTCTKSRLELLKISSKDCHEDVRNTMIDVNTECAAKFMGDMHTTSNPRYQCVKGKIEEYMSNIVEWDKDKENTSK